MKRWSEATASTKEQREVNYSEACKMSKRFGFLSPRDKLFVLKAILTDDFEILVRKNTVIFVYDKLHETMIAEDGSQITLMQLVSSVVDEYINTSP
jgi:hypothetical protein